MRIFLISPVRNVTEDEHAQIADLVQKAELFGIRVYWPERDTKQNEGSLRICNRNLSEIKGADEVWLWWDSASVGSLFDLGMAYGLGKILRVVGGTLTRTKDKSFDNFLLDYMIHRAKYG